MEAALKQVRLRREVLRLVGQPLKRKNPHAAGSVVALTNAPTLRQWVYIFKRRSFLCRLEMF